MPDLRMIGQEFDTSADGILVDEYMRTSVAGVCAAGDCCHVQVTNSTGGKMGLPTDSVGVDGNVGGGEHWFQMKLWTQVSSWN